jgi:Histidinol dehydrogenase
MTIEIHSVADLAPDEREQLFDRTSNITEISGRVTDIIDRVTTEGDVALRDLTEEFDECTIGAIDATEDAERAYDELDLSLQTTIDRAIQTITDRYEPRASDSTSLRRIPLSRVGVCIDPCQQGSATQLLHQTLPAQAAGVDHIAVVLPPQTESQELALGVAHRLEVDRIYRLSRAQAVAALAYGTESVFAVQKIVGGMNQWTAAAKDQVRDDAAIDGAYTAPACVIIANEGTTIDHIVGSLSIHRKYTKAPLVVLSPDEAQLKTVQDRLGCAESDSHGEHEQVHSRLQQAHSGLFSVRSLSEAVGFVNEYSPTVASVQTDENATIERRLKNTGHIVRGPITAHKIMETGPNIGPTQGATTTESPLSAHSFLKNQSVQSNTPDHEDIYTDFVSADNVQD